jgi:hypothetical protein
MAILPTRTERTGADRAALYAGLRCARVMRRGVASAAVLGLATVGCAGAAPKHGLCVKVPQSIPSRAIVNSGRAIAVARGALVYVVLVETPPFGPPFPWGTVHSSDQHVLTPVRLCARTVASSLPVVVSAFRASSVGTATLTAPLVPLWRSRKSSLRQYEARVTIVHKG